MDAKCARHPLKIADVNIFMCALIRATASTPKCLQVPTGALQSHFLQCFCVCLVPVHKVQRALASTWRHLQALRGTSGDSANCPFGDGQVPYAM